MPAILITVDANSAGADAGLQRITGALGGMDRAMGQVSAAAGRLDTAQARLESAITRQAGAYNAAQRAADTYARAQGLVTSGADTSAAAMNRADAAFGRMISTQERAALATQRTADAYRSLAGAQDAAGRASGGGGGRSESHDAASTGGASGGGGEHGNFANSIAGQFLIYQLGFTALSDSMSALKQSFDTGLTTQRNFATMQATTGISAATNASLQKYVMDTAGSGKQPFTSDVLSAGLYTIPSAGVTDPAAIKSINDWAVKFSAFSGSKDTGSAAGALIQTMAEYGVGKGQMAGQAGAFGDVITSMVNLGIVQPNMVAPNVARFGSTAAQYGVGFGEAGGQFAALTYTAPSPDMAALQESRVIQSIGAPNKAQMKAAQELGVSDLLGQQGMKKFTTDLGGYLRELQAAIRLNPGADLKGIFSNRDAISGFQGLLGPGGGNIDRTLATVAATSKRGTTTDASKAYEESPVAKFDNAQAAFKTSVQKFSDAALPLATAMTTALTTLIKPGYDKGGTNNAASAVNSGLGTQNLPGPLQWLGHKVDQAVNATIDPGYLSGGASGGKHAAAPATKYDLTSGVAWGIAMAQMPADTPTRRNGVGAGLGGAFGAIAQQQADTAARARQAGFDVAHGPASAKGNHIAVQDAQDRLTLAIQGFGDKANALGIYEQAVKDDPTYSPVKRHLMDIAAENSVGLGKAGPALAAFRANQAGLGALQAGAGSTVSRFGGHDPQLDENRKLREELREANAKIVALTQKSVALLERIAGLGGATGNGLTLTGSNHSFRGR